MKKLTRIELFTALLAAVTLVNGCSIDAYQKQVKLNPLPQAALDTRPGPDKILVIIGGYDVSTKGIFFLPKDASLEYALSATGAEKSCCQMVTIISCENEKKAYRFRRMSKGELQSIALHDGDKVYFPCTYF